MKKKGGRRSMSDRFDYETARRDLWDMGLDPDELPEKDAGRRDACLRRNKVDPDRYKPRDRGGHGGSGSEGCYPTSACVRARNLPDSCEELTLLRSFRDSYMMRSEEGRAEVEAYYRTAPEIVRAVNGLPNAGEIWERVYTGVILPAVALIRERRLEEARQLYRSCTLRLRERFAPAK